MITKGALSSILAVCSSAETAEEKLVNISDIKERIEKQFEEFSEKGFRTLGIAYRETGQQTAINKEHETDMTFLGFLFFFDPPKKGISETIGNMEYLGISLKVITGDNRLVAASISREIGIKNISVITGEELNRVSDEALIKKVNDADIFAEVEPNQKERIILALRKSGNVVGYIGDGINDTSALHAADVGVSVDTAVDVAKEAADIVLLEKDLNALVEGVKEGEERLPNL
jgi:Mg2+-importing ATPase